MRALASILLLAVCACTLLSCRAARAREETGAYIDPQRVEKIQEKETTKRQLKSWFGDPTAQSREDGAWTYTWSYEGTTERSGGLAGKALRGEKNAETTIEQELAVVFDREDRVESFSWTTSEEETTGSGSEGESGERRRLRD